MGLTDGGTSSTGSTEPTTGTTSTASPKPPPPPPDPNADVMENIHLPGSQEKPKK